jgi:hypothetical protein
VFGGSRRSGTAGAGAVRVRDFLPLHPVGRLGAARAAGGVRGEPSGRERPTLALGIPHGVPAAPCSPVGRVAGVGARSPYGDRS